MGNNILLLAATSKEIEPFIASVKKDQEPFKNKNIDILISGIGLTATAYHLTKQLTLKKYDLVIQAGVAGCFDLKIELGQVVSVRQDTIADQSVMEMKKLKNLFALKSVPHNQYPFKNDWLINPDNKLLKKTGLESVKGISVNEISTSGQKIRLYKEMFDPITESMEGAALHYVCLMEMIPFLQIRSISNYIGERNKKNWDMKESISNLNEVLIRIINNY